MVATTLEQSKKLLEIGIDLDTADMHYWCGSDLKIGGYRAQDEELDIPAWSLSALLDMIYKVERFCVPILYYSDDEDKYWMSIDLESTGYETNMYHDKIDVAFEMVVLLKENELALH